MPKIRRVPNALPPLNRSDLLGETHQGIDTGVLGEDTDWLFALGTDGRHHIAEDVAEAFRHIHGEYRADSIRWTADRVEHVWAVRVPCPRDGLCMSECDWHLNWDGITWATPGAFPLSVLDLLT